MCIKHLTSCPLALDCIAFTVVPLKKDSPSCISESLLAINFVTKDGKKARQIKPCFAYIWSVQRDLLRRDNKSIGEVDRQRIKQLQSISNKAHGSGVYNHLVHITLRLKQNLIPP